MAGGKEIRTKIKSIQNTQKITKAMEMVAAALSMALVSVLRGWPTTVTSMG